MLRKVKGEVMKEHKAQEEQLVDLLVELDEGVVMSALKRASEERRRRGLSDLIETLRKEGIKVAIVPKEKPFWKSKKFWGGVVAFIIFLVLPEHWNAAIPFLVYIFGQGIADIGKYRPERTGV